MLEVSAEAQTLCVCMYVRMHFYFQVLHWALKSLTKVAKAVAGSEAKVAPSAAAFFKPFNSKFRNNVAGTVRGRCRYCNMNTMHIFHLQCSCLPFCGFAVHCHICRSTFGLCCSCHALQAACECCGPPTFISGAYMLFLSAV